MANAAAYFTIRSITMELNLKVQPLSDLIPGNCITSTKLGAFTNNVFVKNTIMK